MCHMFNHMHYNESLMFDIADCVKNVGCNLVLAFQRVSYGISLFCEDCDFIGVCAESSPLVAQ